MLLLAILICLIFSAFFSGMEMAFVSANKLEIELQKDKSGRRGRIISNFYNDSESFLTSMLIGNNIALVAFTFFTTKLLGPTLVPSLGDGFGQLFVITLFITCIVLLFGEFIPKLICGLYSQKLLYLSSFPLLFFRTLLAFPTNITKWFSKGIISYFYKDSIIKESTDLNKTDLEHYIDEALNEDGDEIDKDLFTNALRLDKIKVKDCMVPRTEIVFIDINDSVDTLITTFKKYRHSRVIVAEKDIENVCGYIHHQQVLTLPDSITSSILPIQFIPEAMNIRDLMSHFIKNEMNIACVVDEFGSVSGLITMEDLIEEIFGEIEDEHDQDSFTDIKISPLEYIFSGRIEIEHLNSKYPELDIPSGDYHTLSGFLLSESGKILTKKEKVVIGQFELIAEEVSDTRVELIRLIKEDEIPEK